MSSAEGETRTLASSASEGSQPEATRSLDDAPPRSIHLRTPAAPGEGERYVVLDRVGEGGMAVVYAAFDRALDRKVALKVLKDESREGADARMRREAQALARLKHPNVVAVYDVGRLESGQVFVAMEFVEGGSLRQWLAREKRRREAVLARFLEAGEGLAAAHAAGLVHRDFKPDNVLVGEDGVARVADFGLARAVEEAGAGGAPTDGDAAVVAATVTRAGTLVGTPRYMAPEQLRGARADARVDQFAFGVALFEALYGVPPFEATTVAGLVAAIQRGPKAVRREGVPPWLHALAVRAMAADADARFPSMKGLLDALRADPTKKRRRAYALAALGVVAVAGALGAAKVRHDARLVCRSAPKIATGAWNADRRAKVEAAFAATKVPYAESAAAETTRRLDAIARAIEDGQVDACEASRVRHEQSAASESLRTRCLAQRVEELDAFVSALERADASVVRDAVGGAAALPSAATCADLAALQAPTALPADSEAVRRIDDVRQRLATVRAMRAVGKAKESAPVAEEAARRASEAGYGPVEAEALLLLGDAREDIGDYAGAEDAWKRAYQLAEVGRLDRTRLRAAVVLAGQLARPQGRFKEARVWLDVAADIAPRLADPAVDEDVEYTRGLVDYAEGHWVDAGSHYARALSLALTIPSFDELALARVLNSLGGVSLTLSRYDEARGYYERVRAIWERVYGPNHPQLATAYHNLGAVEHSVGHLGAARQWLERTVAIQEAAFGPDAPRTASSMRILGDVELDLGLAEEALALYDHDLAVQTKALGPKDATVAYARAKTAEALDRLERYDEAKARAGEALAVAEATLPPEHLNRLAIQRTLAMIEVASGDPKRALPRMEASRDVDVKNLGPDHRDVGLDMNDLCRARLALGDARGAKRDGLEAARIFEATTGKDSGLTVDARSCVGEAELVLGEDDALATLEEASATYDATESDPRERARVRFLVARAAAKHGDAMRAITLAARARDELEGVEAAASLRAEIDRWLGTVK